LHDEVISGAVENVTVSVLAALARDEPPTAAALRFLLRAHSATGRDDIRDALEPALARALELAPDAALDEQPQWLVLFAEAAAMSGDDRLSSIAAVLVRHLRSTWGSDRPLDAAAAGVDSCLRAAELVSTADLIRAAIDELERIVGAAYRPGCGVSDRLSDQIAVASALLTAYHATGRVPYSMLAEELVQVAHRTMWDERSGVFVEHGTSAAPQKPFGLNCEAVIVLSRLAALHRAADYRAAAVVAPGADYDADAARMLRSLAADVAEHGLSGAIYALAAAEHQSVL
jgi:hypothetical protein